MSGLEIIPANFTRFTFSGAEFAKWKGEWALLGPEAALPLGELVTLRTWHAGELVHARVVEYLAERVVRRRPGNYLAEVGPAEVRYVMARFEAM